MYPQGINLISGDKIYPSNRDTIYVPEISFLSLEINVISGDKMYLWEIKFVSGLPGPPTGEAP